MVVSADGKKVKIKINKTVGVKVRKWDLYSVGLNGRVEKTKTNLVKEFYKNNSRA